VAERIGVFFVPATITIAAVLLLLTKKDLFASFIKGARGGLDACIQLIPTLVILITAVRMFTASGAMDLICGFLGGLTNKIHIPKEMIPVVIMRPLSGSAASAAVNELFTTSGADSFAGRCASIIMGASDTIIYTLALYFGSCGITRTRHAYTASFLTLIFCVLFSVMLTNIFF